MSTLSRRAPELDVWSPPAYVVPSGLNDPRYGAARARTVQDALGDSLLIARFGDGGRLPEGFGKGLDERVVEYPWLLAHQRGGPALDAGSTLNHAHVLDGFLPTLAPLHIATLRPEGEAYTERGITYVYADLRDLPLRDARFRTVICASTLEHIGADNAVYGAVGGRAENPEREAARAISELVRVAAPDGVILATVPYGRAQDHGWFRQLDRAGVADITAQLAASGGAPSVAVYAHGESGWQVSALDAAAEAGYGDGVPGARAVACVKVNVAG